MILPLSFYNRTNVVQVARDLLGKRLVTQLGGMRTSGRITETEAYAGWGDRACHAANGRRTARNEVMYGPPGRAYVYLCYGIHSLFNVVTNAQGVADAVLIRAVDPLENVHEMLRRCGLTKPQKGFTQGPGRLTKALGIDTRHNRQTLLEMTPAPEALGRTEDVSRESGPQRLCIWIESDGFAPEPASILATPRIGVDYAGEDAKKPWRFLLP